MIAEAVRQACAPVGLPRPDDAYETLRMNDTRRGIPVVG